MLYLLLLLPAMLLLFTSIRLLRFRQMRRYIDAEILKQLIPNEGTYKPFIKHIFLLFAFAFLIVAMARPQIGTKVETVKKQGVEIIIALDVSNSMRSQDIKPNRLERSKLLINKVIDKLLNDKIGLIAFAGESFLQMPLTTDYGAAKLILSSIDTDLIATQGTAIGSAIDLAKKSFSPKEEKINKILLVITDGENHEDDAVESAKEIAEEGVIVHTIGMGTIAGAPIIINNNGNEEYLKESDGSTVLTKINPDVLKEIASAGGGKLFFSNNSSPDVVSILNEINKTEKKNFSDKKFTEYDDKFQIALLIAFGFFILELLTSNQKSTLFSKLKRFIVRN